MNTSIKPPPSIDVELAGGRRRRVFFGDDGEPRRVWLLPRGGKQTERDIRPGTNDWDKSVAAAWTEIRRQEAQ